MAGEEGCIHPSPGITTSIYGVKLKFQISVWPTVRFVIKSEMEKIYLIPQQNLILTGNLDQKQIKFMTVS